MRCKTILLSALVLASSVLAGDVRWGGGSGDYTSGTSWKGGAVPAAGDKVFIDVSANSGTNTITLGSNVKTPISQLDFNSAVGAWTVFDGPDREFLMPQMQENGTYEKEALHFKDTRYQHVFSVSGYDIADWTNSSPFRAVNPYFVFGTAPDGGTSLEFLRGDYNFYNPGGVAYPARTVVIGTSSSIPTSRTAFENCTATFPKLLYAANAPTNILRFASGVYRILGEFGSYQSTGHLINCDKFVVDVDNAELVIAGDTRLYPNSNYASNQRVLDRALRFDVRNGSTLTTTNGFYLYRSTNSVVTVRDSVWRAFGSGATDSTAIGIGYAADDFMYETVNRLVAENSVFETGRAHRYGTFSIGLERYEKRTKGEAYLTNCSITCKAAFELNYADAVLKDCTFYGNTTGSDYSFVVSSDSDVTIDGGTYDKVGGPRLNATSMSVCGPVLRIVDGVFGNPLRDNISKIGFNSTVTTPGVTNTVILSGGTFNARWIELAHGEQAARFVLEGGCLMAKEVHGSGGRRCAGKSGWAHFIGNGGVYRVPAIETWKFIHPIFYDLDALEAGEKGLIVDSNGLNPVIRQGVSDVPGVRGRFVKRGDGTLTVQPVTAWTVSETAVEGGTLIVSTNGVDELSVPVELSTLVSVGVGAVFSTEGEATAVTVDALALTNGVLRLDPGDVITVKGPLSLKGLRLEFTRTPVLGEELDFLVCEESLSSETVLSLRTALLDNALQEDAYAEFDVIADNDGRIRVRFAAKEFTGLNGETSWKGPGSSWSEPSNWSAGTPGAASSAIFSSGAPEAVDVDGDTRVGALKFDSGAFTLGGNGMLSFSSPGASRISVLGGSHSIALSSLAIMQLPVDVALGASLSINSPVFGPGIEKRGRGSLELKSPVSGTLTLGEGLVQVSQASLAGTGEVALGDGTLRIPKGASVENAYIRLASTNVQSAVVLDNAADVTVAAFTPVRGALIKRGSGRLVFDASKGGCSQLAAGKGGHYDDGMLANENKALFEFADDGTPPAFGFGGFNVAGGEVVIRGTGEKVSCKGAIHVGLRTSTDCGAQPSLTIDNVELDAVTGANYQHLTIGYITGDPGNFTSNPVVRVVNGAKLNTVGVFMGYPYSFDMSRTGAKLVFAVTNSTVVSDFQIGFSQLRGNAGVAQVLACGATLNASWYEISGNTDSRVTASTIASKTGDYVKIAGDCYGKGTVLFDGGTLLKVNSVEFKNAQIQYAKMLTFAFDDATWDSGPAGLQLDATTLTGYLALRRFEMRGKGLKLSVPEGATFRSDALFFGSGDLVKTGAGTLSFGEGAFAVSGTVRVDEGILDLSGAGTVTNVVFAGGGGVVSGASFGGRVEIDPGIGEGWTSGALPVFADCSFAKPVHVKIDPSLSCALTLPSAEGVAVAKFTGAAPDVSRWRVRNVWDGPGVKGRFTVVGDTVRMTVDRAGFSVIVK